jgi:glucokinase-like ROK family protein
MKKATRQQTKTHNTRLILKTIYDQGNISRADIARATRLTRPTVSAIVADLMAEDLVAEVGQGPSAGGKRPTLLAVAHNSFCLLCVDLGAQEFRGAIVDLLGEIDQRFYLPTNDQKGEAALQLIFQMIDTLMEAAPLPILGIGIGTPGIIDTHQGIIYEAVNLGWRDLPMQTLLQERYDLPVHLANDSQAAALGELVFGHSEKATNMVLVKVGSGISAGIVLNGRIYGGDNFSPGEIGHQMVLNGDKPCTCGSQGCLETVASSRAVIEGGNAIIQAQPDSILAQLAAEAPEVNLDLVLEAFAAGDTAVHALIGDVGRYLGTAVANLASILNIQQIIIGGQVSRFGETLLDAIRHEVDQQVLGRIAANTHIELNSLGSDMVILGAAAMVLSRELGVV